MSLEDGEARCLYLVVELEGVIRSAIDDPDVAEHQVLQQEVEEDGEVLADVGEVLDLWLVGYGIVELGEYLSEECQFDSHYQDDGVMALLLPGATPQTLHVVDEEGAGDECADHLHILHVLADEHDGVLGAVDVAVDGVCEEGEEQTDYYYLEYYE